MVAAVLVIGIGTGDPNLLTLEAVAALNEVDVFLVADKGESRSELMAVREDVCRRFITGRDYRFIRVPDPQREPDAQRDAGEYDRGVRRWHTARTDAYGRILDSLPPDAVVGFLTWGDPAFYDSTLRIVNALQVGRSFKSRVIPGISAVQLLAARHRIPLNRVGQPIHVTTGRRLVAEYRPDLGDVVVMLDGQLACAGLLPAHPDLMIYWGAYLGSASEALLSGPLGEVIGQLQDLRARLRQQHGWIMDTYLLRPPSAGAGPGRSGQSSSSPSTSR